MRRLVDIAVTCCVCCILIVGGTVLAQRTLGDQAVSGVFLNGPVTTTAYVTDHVIPAGGATLGPTAPTWGENGAANHCSGLEFDGPNEKLTNTYEIPDCWDGAGNFTFKIYWCTDGAAIGAGETVKFDINWRSLDWGAEDTDNGTVATGTVTYTQSGAGDAQDTWEHEITMPYTGGNQPLAAGDVLVVHFLRDTATDTFANGAVIQHYELSMSHTSLKCDHTN